MNTIIKTLGTQAARQAAGKHIGQGATLDPKRGWAMMRDRGIAPGAKVSAIAIGLALTAALVALEVPLEAVVGFFLPAVGLVSDALFDGAEFILGPMLFASMALPFLVKKAQEVRVVVQPAPPQMISGR